MYGEMVLKQAKVPIILVDQFRIIPPAVAKSSLKSICEVKR
jgi:hypothetical protein